MKLLIASNNKHKAEEIRGILGLPEIILITLKDLGIAIEVEEDKDTLEGNSEKKAKEIYAAAGIPTVADDTGLFVDALGGEPGVYSSRYAGENASYEDNCNKLIESLSGIELIKRTAHFKTVVCFFDGKETYCFEGLVNGKITETKKGESGFGYDPIFLPDGYESTYAEIPIEIKNTISHRAKAFQQFSHFLKKYSEQSG